MENKYVIFRVQDKDGRGPWKPGFSHEWVEVRKDHDNLLPWFAEFGRIDKKALPGMVLGSGCKSIKQLKRWFTLSEYSKLKQYKYHAVKMEVGRILAESNIQCFFERAKPLKEDIEIVELYT